LRLHGAGATPGTPVAACSARVTPRAIGAGDIAEIESRLADGPWPAAERGAPSNRSRHGNARRRTMRAMARIQTRIQYSAAGFVGDGLRRRLGDRLGSGGMFRSVGIRRLLGAMVVILCVAVPVVEAFDSWDRTLQDGNDTEANVVLVAVTIGVALLLEARLAAAPLMALPEPASPRRRVLHTTSPRVGRSITLVPTGNPPVALRI
jgi:hypothetical protein